MAEPAAVTSPGHARDGTWRRDRLRSARLYLCVDRRATQGDLADLLDAVLAGGVDVVQLRDKDADRPALVDAAAIFRDAAIRHGALFVLNDDPELAAEVDADGVHVGQDDAAYAPARAAVGDERLVGRSTHSVAELERALSEPHDYVAVGPVHATPTKAGRPAVGLGPVAHAATIADRPWFVTGGMAEGTIPEARAAGMRGAVVVRALTEAADPGSVARRLAALLSDRSGRG